MDLVDIDLVLDNLELREATDEKNKALAQQKDNNHKSSAPPGSVNNGYITSPPTSNPQRFVSAPSGSSYSKNFVGVSQVFNSLDDYCKNVESLQQATCKEYDEELRPVSAISSQRDGNSTLPDIRLNATASVAAIEVVKSASEDVILINEKPNQYEQMHNERDRSRGSSDPPNANAQPELNDNSDEETEEEDEVEETNEDDEDTEDVDTDDDDDVTNDILKFKEPVRGIKSDDNGATASSDSLTTSSCSTFSSGPSFGFASTTDEQHSAAVSPADAEEQNALLTAQDEEDELNENEQEEEEDQNDESQNHVQEPEKAFIEPAVQEESVSGSEQVNVDELASGLSSIVITSEAHTQPNFPLETADSSAFENVLATTTTSPMSQNPEINGIENQYTSAIDSNSIVAVPLSFLESEPPQRPEPEKMVNCVEESSPQQPAPKEIVQQQQPITFGSTMDEISDTELDSMLQEMDIDELGDHGHSKSAGGTIDEIVPELNEVIAADDVDNGQSNALDSANADSFSQASTVEFADIKATQIAYPSTKENEASTASIASSSYTSSESSFDADEEVGSTIGVEEELGDGQQQRPQRPTTLDLPAVKTTLYAHAGQTPPGIDPVKDSAPVNSDAAAVDTGPAPSAEGEEAFGFSDPHANLGKYPPIWVPDNMATGCMQCHTKFTMIKRRHHCRACGKVLCSVCCSQKFKLEFLPQPESRVCVQCYLILSHRQEDEAARTQLNTENPSTESHGESIGPQSTPTRSPNPNNPMEYCSTIPPHRQVSNTSAQPPSVIVPVSVLKRSNSNPRKRKSVMFSDGIAPGSDLATLDSQWTEPKHARKGHQQTADRQRGHSAHKPPTPGRTEASGDSTALGLVTQLFRGSIPPSTATSLSESSHDYQDEETTASQKVENKPARVKKLPPLGCDEQGCFIPKAQHSLPPLFLSKDDANCNFDYKNVVNNEELVERLKHETLKFALEKNFFVYVKIVNLKCCMNRTVINFTTSGMHHVGNDEIIILLEYEPVTNKDGLLEPPIPKDIFQHLYEVYHEADQGNSIAELSFTSPRSSTFLGSVEYGGFIYIRATFQCLQDVIVPESPFLIGILIHRYEVPWAKIFPLRLMLRLGAQYRYYPCPHISMVNRDSVYAEIAQTIINLLADFRNYSYTLPYIRGMCIHMEDRQTTVMIPRNRQEDIIKAISNSSDHILAFGGNFSKTADGHLVCMQNLKDDHTYSYSTQAINIQGQPRKVTGASFFVLNEALKSTSGLSGKCSIVEDGLMVQILPSKMEEVRNALRNQNDIDIICGPVNADEQHTEIVSIKWMENDRDFNVGVKSPIDDTSMEGVSTMRVHASFNYSNANYSIRLTAIYMIKFDEWYSSNQTSLANTSVDLTRIAEQIARSASFALVPFLDLLAASGNHKIGIRATLHQDNVCYEAGARGNKLPPLYMNALDNHLIGTLHNESNGIEDAIILELIFYILNI